MNNNHSNMNRNNHSNNNRNNHSNMNRNRNRNRNFNKPQPQSQRIEFNKTPLATLEHEVAYRDAIKTANMMRGNGEYAGFVEWEKYANKVMYATNIEIIKKPYEYYNENNNNHKSKVKMYKRPGRYQNIKF